MSSSVTTAPAQAGGASVVSSSSQAVLAWSAAFVTVLIWTAFIVIARATADPSRGGTLTPFDVTYARILGASIFLLPWGWVITRRDKRSDALVPWVKGNSSLLGISPLPLRRTLQIGIPGGLLYAMVAYSGFVFAPAAHASVLMPGSLPLWTSLLAIFVLSQPITKWRALGLVCILAGDLLVGGKSLLHAFDGSGIWRGDVFFMCASFTWSFYTVLMRRFALDAVRATIAITALAFVVYVPIYTILAGFELIPAHIFTAPMREVLWQMFTQGVLSVVVSGISFNIMIRHFGPVRSTMMTAIVPGLSAVSASLILGEPLFWNVLLGLSLVTAGILFGVKSASKSANK